MGNYLIAPGGESKHYNYRLNIIFEKIGQVYCGGTRRDGIYYIMHDVHDSSTTQIKMMLSNKKRLINRNIEDGYIYKIHKTNYTTYVRNLLLAIEQEPEMVNFVKERFIKNPNTTYFETILNDGIVALNRLINLGLGDDSYKAYEILNEILGLNMI